MSTTQPRWHKASASYANGNCVEVATLHDGQIGIRDSKDPGGPVLTLTPSMWAAFLNRVRDGEFTRTFRTNTASIAD